jgi:hypothetical protein
MTLYFQAKEKRLVERVFARLLRVATYVNAPENEGNANLEGLKKAKPGKVPGSVEG